MTGVGGEPRDFAAFVREVRRRFVALERRQVPTPAPPDPQLLALTGEGKVFFGSVAPTGWLLCQGQSLLRTDYPALLAVIGTTYGAADSTHFSLPNLKGRVPVGLDTSQTEFNTLGTMVGAKTHTLIADEMPAHTHAQRFASNAIAAGGGGAVGGMTSAGGASPIAAEQITSSAGLGQPHNNLPPEFVVNFIIKT